MLLVLVQPTSAADAQSGSTANGPQQLTVAGLSTVAHQGKIASVAVSASGAVYMLLDYGDGVRVERTDLSGSVVSAAAHLGAAGDSGVALTLDPAGNVYVTGTTTSSALTATAGSAVPARTDSSTNSFVAKLDPTLKVLFLSFTGGSRIAATSIAATADAVFVTGIIYSANLPATTNALQQTPAAQGTQNGFIERFSASGSTLVYATYLGGAGGSTTPAAIAADAADEAFVAGSTSASGFPTVAALVPVSLGGTSGFLARVSPAGDALLASTFVPGAGLSSAAIDSTGKVLLVSGTVALGQFPVDTVATPLLPTAYQTLLRLPLDLSAVLSGVVLAPGTQSTIAPGPGGSAWAAGSLTTPLLPLAPLANIGDGFAVQVAQPAGASSFAVTEAARLGGAANGNLSYASLPLNLLAVAVAPAGDALLGGALVPTASASLLASETYDLPLVNTPTAVLPDSVRSAESSAATCSGSLCTGSAGFLARLTPVDGASLAFSTDDAPVLVLRNLGSVAAGSLALSVTVGSFASSCGATLAPGAECALLLSGGAAGAVTATYRAGPGAGSAQSQTAPFPAFGPAASPIVFLPKELDFGIVSAASAAPLTRTLTVTNLATSSQVFSSKANLPPKTTTPFAEVASDCPVSGLSQTKVLDAGATCHITLAFTANASSASDGFATAQWTVGARDAMLTAYSQAAALSLSATEVDFGTQIAGGLRAPRHLYLSNSSTLAVAHTQVVAPAGSAFSVTDSCGSTLSPGSVCALRIDYNSGSAQANDSTTLALDGDVSVLVTGQAAPQPGAVGTSVNPNVSVAPGALSFTTPVVVTSVSSVSPTVTIMNSGSSAVAISLAVTGDFAEVDSCGAVLQAGATCSAAITFAPSAPGSRTGLLMVGSGSAFSSVAIPLSGTATAIVSAGNGNVAFGSTPVGQPTVQFFKVSQPFATLSVKTTGPYTVALVEDAGFGPGNPPATAYSTAITQSCSNCFLAVRFLPTAAGAQPGTATLSTAKNGVPSTLALTGTGVALAALSLLPAAADFGSVPVGSTGAPLSLTLSNQLASGSSVAVGSTAVTGDFTLLPTRPGATPCAGTLAPGSSCVVAVSFAPSATGARSGAISITTSDGVVTGTLSGTGLPGPDLALQPNALSFANVPGSTATTQSVTLTNMGGGAAMVGSLGIVGSNGGSGVQLGFAVSSNCAALAPQASCTATVVFTPGSAIVNATLNAPVTQAGQLTTYTVPLSGLYTASSAGLAMTPATAAFGPVATSTLGPTSVFTVSNLTTKTLALSTDYPRGFVPAGPACTALAPNASCSFSVSFLPLTNGLLPGSIALRAVPSDGTQTLTAIAYAEGYGLGGGGLAFSGALITSSVLDFGQSGAGQSATQILQLINRNASGSAPVTVRRITSLPPFLSTSTCGLALAPGQGCAITVNYTPTGQTGGTAANSVDTGLLTVETDAASGPLLLNLTGQAAPNSGASTATLASYTLSEGALSFAPVSVGNASPAQTVTLTNTGSGTLRVLGVAAPADFTVQSACAATVAPGTSCLISISSTPQTAGLKIGALALSTDSSVSLDYVSLLGSGTAPALTLNPQTLNFGSVQVGSSYALSVQVANTGGTPVQLASVLATGNYTTGGTCAALISAGTSLAANATCTIQVTFSPQTGGSLSGILSVASSASTLPLTVSLSGLGLQSSLQVTPPSLAFGSIVLGSPASLSLTLQNAGTASVTGLVLSTTGDFSVTQPCPSATLVPGASCTAQITFTPGALGARTGVLTITSSDPSSPLRVPLSGSGVQNGSFTLTVNGSSAQTVSVVSGQPASYQLTVTPTGGFTGSVALTCAATTPAQFASCALAPASLTLAGNGQTATVTINTITSVKGYAQGESVPLRPVATTMLCALLPGLLVLWRRRPTLRTRLPYLAALAFTSFALVALGCGSGGDPNLRYTPAGTYQYQATAASTSGNQVSQTVTLNLIVTPR